MKTTSLNQLSKHPRYSFGFAFALDVPMLDMAARDYDHGKCCLISAH